MLDTYYIGIDIGQSLDPTALAVLRRSQERDRPSLYELVYLRRVLGLPYVGTPANPGLVEGVRNWFRLNPQAAGSHAAVDRTGVGRAVLDAFRAAGLPCALWGLTITGGRNVTQEGLDLTVPKHDLVGVAQALLGGGRLVIDPRLPEAETLRRELKTFQVKITAAGNETFAAWREGAHDDLVFAVSMACWLGERFGSGDPRKITSGGGFKAPPGVFGTFGGGPGGRPPDARHPPKNW